MTLLLNNERLAPRATREKGPMEIDFGPHEGKAIANWHKLNALMPFISQVLGQAGKWRAVEQIHALRRSDGYAICAPRWCMPLTYKQWQALSLGLRHLGTTRILSFHDGKKGTTTGLYPQPVDLGRRARTEYNRLSRYRRAL